MTVKKSDEVSLTIYGFRTFGEEHFSEEFFEMLKDANPAYLPIKIGMYEPIRTPFSINEAKKMWVKSEKENVFCGGIMLKGREFFGDISWKLNDNSNIIGFHLPRKLIVKDYGTEKFIGLAKKLFLWANGVWGYVCHSSNSMYTPGLTFRTCIGGIPWMTLFGPPYVEMFGKKIIQTVPSKVEEFDENRFMILTSDEPMEINPKLLEIQARVRKHLGEDAFCRHDVPKRITVEDLKAGKARPNEEGYRSPNLSVYTKDNKKEAGEGIIVKINDDGTMAKYKIKPEKKQ